MREENEFLKKKLEAMKRVLQSADEQIRLLASGYAIGSAKRQTPQAPATPKSPGSTRIGAISGWSTGYAKSETPKNSSTAVPSTLSGMSPQKRDEYIEADTIIAELHEEPVADNLNSPPEEEARQQTSPLLKREPQPEVTIVDTIAMPPETSAAATGTAAIPEHTEEPTTVPYDTHRSHAEIKKVLKQIFNHFDTDKDGKLSLPEVAAAGMAAQNWGFTLEPLSRTQMKDLMRSAFGDDGKKISRQRFVDVCATSSVPVLQECADTITHITELIRPGDAGGEPLIQDKDDEPVTTKTFFLKRPLRKVSVKGKSGRILGHMDDELCII